ncbi:MAG: guanylate kinase [Bdellovibrionales bacterium]|nr:guanylate kinase [Bdellovibrionales bacterium]
MKHSPLLVCIAGPTASGKSTICKALIPQVDGLKLSVSTTTRAPRPGETDGVDYNFVSTDEFKRRVDDGAFIEHAQFSGNMYGTEWVNVDRAEAEGYDLVFEIEVQGVQQLKARYGDRLTTVFVFPVSFAELEKRLRGRATDSEEQIQQRLKRAKEEVAILSDTSFSDYLVINDSLDAAIVRIKAIISAERCRLDRLTPKQRKSLGC